MTVQCSLERQHSQMIANEALIVQSQRLFTSLSQETWWWKESFTYQGTNSRYHLCHVVL